MMARHTIDYICDEIYDSMYQDYDQVSRPSQEINCEGCSQPINSEGYNINSVYPLCTAMKSLHDENPIPDAMNYVYDELDQPVDCIDYNHTDLNSCTTSNSPMKSSHDELPNQDEGGYGQKAPSTSPQEDNKEVSQHNMNTHPCPEDLTHNEVAPDDIISSALPNERDHTHSTDNSLITSRPDRRLAMGGNVETSGNSQTFVQAVNRQAALIFDMWPHVTPQAQEAFPNFAKLYMKVKSFNLPNFLGAKVEISSDLVHHEWENRLQSYHDKELCLFLKYGWPLGYHARVIPKTVDKNHPSATAHMGHVEAFIKKELSHKAVIGPFDESPFDPWLRVSPLMTREKRESTERRIILDLSYPHGESVNDGIRTEDHFGANITYTLPSITDLIETLKRQGQGALIWKADLTRAYRQLRADPLDTPLLDMAINGKIYLDLCPPFGCRSSAALCQRVANALTYMMGEMGYTIISYLTTLPHVTKTRGWQLNPSTHSSISPRN